MKKKLADLFRNRKIAAGVTAVVLAVAVGSTAVVQQRSQIPELPSYTDPVLETTIEEDETPLASQPKVNTKTSKNTSTKKVTMKKAATKSYTKSLPKTSTTTKKTAETGSATVVTQTKAVKAVTEKYTKKSKVKVVTTTTTTTVTTTTTAKADTAANSGTATNVTTTTSGNSTPANYTADIAQIAPDADSRVLNAYKTLGFTVEVNSSVSYAGYFDARTRKITLKKADDTIYHELGHFVAFIAGNVDKSAEFTAVYNQEKALYTGYNKAYATQSSSEYFAESVKDYTVNPASLKSSRPKTYEAVKSAVETFTNDRIARVQKVYGPIWK